MIWHYHTPFLGFSIFPILRAEAFSRPQSLISSIPNSQCRGAGGFFPVAFRLMDTDELGTRRMHTSKLKDIMHREIILSGLAILSHAQYSTVRMSLEFLLFDTSVRCFAWFLQFPIRI